GDLAFLGPAAPARDGVLAAARDTLLARAPVNLLVLGGGTEELTAVLDHADRLRRRDNRPADALTCYYSALPLCLERADADELGASTERWWMSAHSARSPNGWGTTKTPPPCTVSGRSCAMTTAPEPPPAESRTLEEWLANSFGPGADARDAAAELRSVLR